MTASLRAAIEYAVVQAEARAHPSFRGRSASAVDLLLAPTPWTGPSDVERPRGWWLHVVAGVLASHPDAQLRHVARLVALAPGGVLGDVHAWRVWAAERGPLDLGQVEAAFAREHIPSDDLLAIALELGPRVEIGSLRAFLEAHPDRLPAIVAEHDAWLRSRFYEQIARALEAIGPSPALAEALLPTTLTAPRALAPVLRRATATLPAARVATGLGSRAKQERLAAAEILADRRDPSAVPALRAALKKEKIDDVRVAILGALDACGADTELDPETLAADARERLAKGWPDALAFVAPETLPALRWKEGAEVAPEIVRAWILSAYAKKDPEPSPLVRLVAARMDPATTAALARVLLDRWIAWDTRLPTDLTEAERERVEMIAGHASMGQTVHQLLARPDAKNWGLPVRSGIGEKGVLGVVAALGTGALVPTIDAYVRRHRGFRGSQSRAMLAVLSWIDDPRATQALLRIAAGFRTPGIQKEARLVADALATRRGWTVAELADRTVPTAGLDDDGTMTLVYGRPDGEGEDVGVIATRRFVARLDEGDALALEDESGVRVASLPDARKDEDPALVAEARKRFVTARKELKTLFDAQRARLHEAMLAGRTWPLVDFEAYVLRHPVLGRLARRVILASFEGARLVSTFRAAGDGTLVSVAHDTISLDPSTVVGVAHGTLMSAELERAWSEHLADYRLVSLFPQLARPEPPADRIALRRLVPIAKPGLLAIEVRSRAKRAGYAEVRGDGGVIDCFAKSLGTIDRALVIEVEGIEPMADKKALANVHGIVLRRGADLHASGDALDWSSVGPVLRAEAWAEIGAIVS